MEERNKFIFYCSWENQINNMNDDELRRFIKNLIKWHQNEDVELPTREDKFIWDGVLPVLKTNHKKWSSRAEASKKNGKLGGRPKKT